MTTSDPIKELFNQGPKIISASAKSPAGVISLMMLVFAVLGYAFFEGSSESVKIGMFMLMFLGFFALCLSVLRKSSELSRGRGRERSETFSAPDLPILGGVSLRVSFGRLALIWGIGSSLVFMILLLQFLFGHFFGESVLDVWVWLGPTIIPPVSLVVIGLACSFWDNRDRVRPLLTICCWLSLLYLTIALATIFVQPFLEESEIRLLKLSTLILTPLEGIQVALTALLLAWVRPPLTEH
jgi:magnesium-transporting ATPase (P-type)